MNILLECLSCDVFKKDRESRSFLSLVIWYEFSKSKPDLTRGCSFLVALDDNSPAFELMFDGENFYDVNDNIYSVKYWAYLPFSPSMKVGDFYE